MFLLQSACHVISPNVNFISVSWYNEINVVKAIRSMCIVLKNLVYQDVFPTREGKSNSNDLKQ